MSFDIVNLVKSFLTEMTMSIDTKAPNGLSLNFQGIRPGNIIWTRMIHKITPNHVSSDLK